MVERLESKGNKEKEEIIDLESSAVIGALATGSALFIVSGNPGIAIFGAAIGALSGATLYSRRRA
ncbi:MAG: hypothetical protein WBA22_10520 [Candidatus Methanofastidiosia archaeon]